MFRKIINKINRKNEIKTSFNRLSFSNYEIEILLSDEKVKPEKQKTCLSGYFKHIKGLIRN